MVVATFRILAKAFSYQRISWQK